MPLTSGRPSDIQYLDAIQTPQVCFTDPRLKAARIQKDDRGIPLAATGRSAIVFRAGVGTKDVALRCFTREAREQRLRYQELHAHLAGSIPSYMVDFTYRDREILVAGALYPVVEMGWAEGQPLHLQVEQHLRDPRQLERLAAIWLETVTDLQNRRMAHGDLSTDNCLATEDALTLIDYDGCFIPALARADPGEGGNPNFQHPRRMGYYALSMDAFPALVIYLSLLALAVDKSLWQFHNGRNLIFTAGDYLSPRETPVWRALDRTSNQQIAPLLSALADMCNAPINDLPPLTQLTAGSSGPSRRRIWQAVPKTVTGVQGQKGRERWRRALTWPTSIFGRPRWRRATFLISGAAVIIIILIILLTGGGSPRSINSVTFSSDTTTTLASTDAGGGIYLWNIPAKNLIATLADPSKQAITSVAFSPDGKTFAAADAGGRTYLWNIAGENLIATLADSSKQAVTSVAFSPDGKTFAAADAGGSTYLWNIAGENLIATLADSSKQAVTSVAFSPDGKTLAAADAGGRTYLWDIAAKNVIGIAPEPSKQAVTSVAFSPDGKTLATADAGGSTYLWSMASKNLIATLADSSKQAVTSVAFSPDSKTFAAADAGGATYLWNIPGQKLMTTLTDPSKQAVTSVAFSPDGKTLAGASAGGGTYLWNIPAKIQS